MSALPILGGFALLLLWALRGSSKAATLPGMSPKSLPTPQPVTDEEVNQAIDAEVFSDESITSPFKVVSDEQWREFTNWAKQGKLGTITPGYRLGLYLLDTRQLEDIGRMSNVHKVKYQGRDVYNGDWIAPLSLQGFLSSQASQYEAFAEIMNRWGKSIQNSTLIGKSIAGQPATFSGLLGAAKVAGLQGMITWSKDPSKYPTTTRAYIETNGMF